LVDISIYDHKFTTKSLRICDNFTIILGFFENRTFPVFTRIAQVETVKTAN